MVGIKPPGLRPVLVVTVMVFHVGVLLFCLRINLYRGLPLDEARYVPAGVAHWGGAFGPANDSPPLARMVAASPLLAVGVKAVYPADGPVDGARERELTAGGRFASLSGNPRWFLMFCLARGTGFLWWLLGAWVLFGWSAGLYGGRSGWVALALWGALPNVLAFEYRATPDLPLAVLCAWATRAFGDYLDAPSREAAVWAGVLLGFAQLVEFAALGLLVVWPLLALTRRLAVRGPSPPGVGPRARLLHAASAVAVGVGVVNLGYAFDGSGSPLGGFAFRSRALGGGADRAAPGNRFRGTWLGGVPCPLPSDYVKGLDRRSHERESAPRRRDDGGGGPSWRGRSLAEVGGRVPFAVVGLMVWGLVLRASGRRPAGAPWVRELTLWVPAVTAMAMTSRAFGPLPPARGTLLAAPFAVVLASQAARALPTGRRGCGWVTAGLLLWAAVDGLATVWVYQFTPGHRAQFRQDVAHLRDALGLPGPGPGASPGAGRRGHGLSYRTFVDSRGVPSNYAMFVPRGYRGDRPYPMIVFLHGYGDAGRTGRQFTAVGLPFLLGYREIDFLVLCPQAHDGDWAPGGDDARRAMELIDVVSTRYRVDPDRVALTGLSTGGTGVWNLAARFPDRWAAIVPVSSGVCPTGRAGVIKHIPCWCFHNRYDGGSPAAQPRAMVAALRAAGGRPRYTEFEEVTHNAWDQAYATPGLYDWLSRQRRP